MAEQNLSSFIWSDADLLRATGGLLFYNTSPLDLKKLMGDQDHIGENLRAYVQGFSQPFAVHETIRQTVPVVSEDN